VKTKTPEYENRDLRSLCRTAIVLRAIVVGAALAVIAFLRALGMEFTGMMPVTGLLLVVFPLNALWWVLAKSGGGLKRLLYAQILADLAVEGGVVYFTGGVSGHMTVVFLATVFTAGIMLSLRGALSAATIATALLGLTSAAQQVDLDQHIGMAADGRARVFLVLNIVLQGAFFYLVAFLSGHLYRRALSFGRELETTADELQRTKLDTSQIIESMNSGLVTIDLEGRITKANQAASRILGVTPAEALGRDVNKVLREVCPEMITKMMGALLEGTEDKRAEVDVTSNGHKTPLGVSVSPMADNQGRRAGVVCVFQDLTEVKSMEEKVRLADRMAALGELSAGIAHEIKTPLASICGSVEMLRDALPDEGEDRKLVDLVVKESDRLRNIIDHFLQFARSRPVRIRRIALGAVLGEVVCMVRNHPRFTDGMTIDLNVDEAAGIAADEESVRQVFYNLAANAVEAMGPSGRLEITAEPEAGTSRGRFMRIVFKDNGEGMNAETKAQAFRPFYTGKRSGTGLGLAIVSRIVEEHGGTIEMESTQGQGTTVSVCLPCEIDEEGATLCGALPENGYSTNT
jgi:two-component system sensor histidine kinase PilS (NtrC family)